MNYKFPENFWWGAATSGPQAEGRFNKKHRSVFDYWYDIEPDAFFDKVGPDIASNFYNSYKEDIAMMKSIGFNSFRTSIQWTRLIDDFETASVDEDGVRYYNSVIDEAIKNGVTPVMCLHHFDLPIELYEKYGGWESKHVSYLFSKFAKVCFELFGDRVKYWATFNEPIVVIEGQYINEFHYPKVVDGKKAVQAAFNINLASAKAIEEFRKCECSKTAKIGIILNLTPAYPRSNSKEDIKAAEFANKFNNRIFLDPAVHGRFPDGIEEILEREGVLWENTEEEMKTIENNKIDFLGVNYYQPLRVKKRESEFDNSKGWLPYKHFEGYDMPGKKINPHRGWEIYPEAMYDIAINIRDNYNNIPWYVSENGMGVYGEEKFLNEEGMIVDDYRIEFATDHLKFLHKGITEGSNCFGYHLWTPIDCWSWSNAYRNRYGFISLDLNTQKKTIKKSGYWYKRVTENNGF